jgi:phospholipid/cholesterol/gamma-HCH transport system substrate-binding protein
MTINNETKVGILAIVALAAAFWGYKFLKGQNVLTSAQIFYVKYANVDQLRPSSPVFINGLQVGLVKDITVDKQDDKTLIVTLNIDKGIEIPKDATADIIGLTLMGGKAIEIVIPHPCEGDGCAQSETYLEGRTRSLARSLLGDPAELDAYVAKVRMAFDTIADPNSPEGLGPSMKAMETTLVNLALVSANLNSILAQNRNDLAATMSNVADITRNLKGSNSDIAATMANLKAVSDQIKGAGIDGTAKKAGAALDSIILTLGTLRNSLEITEKSLGSVEALASNLVNGNGTAGKLLTDDAAYFQLVNSSRQISLFLQDFRLNPKRYTTVKAKVFGKNRTKDYKSPLEDPAYQMLFDSLGYDYYQRLKAADK